MEVQQEPMLRKKTNEVFYLIYRLLMFLIFPSPNEKEKVRFISSIYSILGI